MTCTICLDDITNLEYITILKCGHFYHRDCFSKSKKEECCICRACAHTFTNTVYNSAIENVSKWTQMDFVKHALFINDNKDKIKKIKQESDLFREKEYASQITEVIDKFMEDYLSVINFKILKLINEGKKRGPVLEYIFDQSYGGFPVIFLVKGPSGVLKKDYLKKIGVSSILERLRQKFELFRFRVIRYQEDLKDKIVVDFRL